jgi:hypothetical protein
MVCKSQLLRASNAEWNRTTDNKQPIIISVVVVVLVLVLVFVGGLQFAACCHLGR